MIVPKYLKIGGHAVKIEMVDYEPHIYGNMGVSWNNYNLIQLNTKYPESQIKGTILHELLHHIMDNLGLEYKQKDSDAIHSERTVEALSQAIYQVLNDNPDFVKMFLKGK